MSGERKSAEEALRRSELKYRTLHESMRDAFVSVAMDGRIREYNTAYREMSGIPMRNWSGRVTGRLPRRNGMRTRRRSSRNRFSPGGSLMSTGKSTRKKDGTVFPVRAACFPDQGRERPSGGDVGDRPGYHRARPAGEGARACQPETPLMNIIAWHDIQNKVTSLRGYVESAEGPDREQESYGVSHDRRGHSRTIDTQIQYTKEYQEIGMQPPRWIRIRTLSG